MSLERKLPKDTNDLIASSNIDNFNLKLNKAAFFDGDKFIFFKKADNKQDGLDIQPDYTKIDINAITEHYKKTVRKLGLELKSIIFKPDWRLIVGLGNESVYETSMTLHHIYGFPYVPGSAVKGVARSYYIAELYDEIGLTDIKQINVIEKVLENFVAEKDENIVYEDFKRKFSVLCGDKKINATKEQFDYFRSNNGKITNFQDIFGTQNKKGKVIFFDTFPLEPPKIKPDIMNPHYGPYYSDSSGKIPPADYHNPVPIFFLTVKETPFEFTIGIKEKDNIIIQDGEFKDKTPLEVAYEYMKKVLTEHGIGAKTAVGYGYFADITDKERFEYMTEDEKREVLRQEKVERDERERKKLIETLNEAGSAQQKYFSIDEVIKYFEVHLSDTVYKEKLFDVMFDFKKLSILRGLQLGSGIINSSYELYMFIKENNDEIKADTNLLEKKLSKIMMKLGSKKLKNKWKQYFESKN
ncbi:MAG TPA: type III-B CRISPR module RAMP protein Cmr6 [Ignavibacteria bacterium]|nr:type III-B CRISPR module RAMP protein Cmr6 [Ignavibacteria bacterium]